jgi:hypothetical protein
MIYLTSCLNKRLRAIVHAMLLAALLTGCTGRPSGLLPLRIDAVAITAEGNVARRDALQVNCLSSGGQGELSYDFRIEKNGVESRVQRGRSPELHWIPKEPGDYRLRVMAEDAAGTFAESGWSNNYRFEPPLSANARYAVLPVENLSDSKAPLQEIHARLVATLAESGLQILNADILEGFMQKHRIRHVGGLNSANSRQLRDELKVDGVVISALETWHAEVPPRVSLITRVVTTGRDPEIIWMDSVGLAGDAAPGLLGLGRVNDVRQLLNTGLKRLADSFQNCLAGRSPGYRHGLDGQGPRLLNGETKTADEALGPLKNGHWPKYTFRSPSFDPSRQYRVAVVPFLNVNARKHAGTIVSLHLVKQLNRYENLRIVEPGQVRDILLRYRMIMRTGPSLAAADVLADARILGAQLIISGKVFDYQDAIGESKVDFSMQAFEGDQRQVIWTSHSYARGNDGVYFFDRGRIPTAHGLAGPMAEAAIQLLQE